MCDDKQSADKMHLTEFRFTRISCSLPLSFSQRELWPHMSCNLVPYLWLETALAHLWQPIDQEIEHLLDVLTPPVCVCFMSSSSSRLNICRVYNTLRVQRLWRQPRRVWLSHGLTMGMTPHTPHTPHNYVLCIWHPGNSSEMNSMGHMLLNLKFCMQNILLSFVSEQTLRLSNIQLIDMFSESGCHCPSSTLTCCSSTAAHTWSNAGPSIPKQSSHIPWLPGLCTYIPQCCHLNLCPCFFSSSTSHLPLVQHLVILQDFVSYAPGISIRHSLHSY